MGRDKVNVGVRQPYIRVIGLQVDTVGPGRSSSAPVAGEEEEELRNLSMSPNIYETIARSIAPSIFGSMDIKKAIACLLLGGSRKKLAQELLILYLSFLFLKSFKDLGILTGF